MKDTRQLEQTLYLIGLSNILDAITSEDYGRELVKNLHQYHLEIPRERRISGSSVSIQNHLDTELAGYILRRFKGELPKFIGNYNQFPQQTIQEIYEQAKQRQEEFRKGFEHLVSGSSIGADLVMRLLNEPSIDIRRNGRSRVIDTKTFRDMLQREAVLYFHEEHNGKHDSLARKLERIISEGRNYDDALEQEAGNITKRALTKIPSKVVTD